MEDKSSDVYQELLRRRTAVSDRTPLQDTIVAVATPRGHGAVGIVRLSGPGALGVAETFTLIRNRENSPASWPPAPRRAFLGTAWDRGPEGGRATPLDRVILTYYKAPDSYTGEDAVEICAHGSPFILERLVHLSLTGGARLAQPGEFTFRAFLNGKLDLAQAEAVCNLIHARTQFAHRSAMAHLLGGFSARIKQLRQSLLDLISVIEVNLDHPEEDVPEAPDPAGASMLEEMARIRSDILHLLEKSRLGSILLNGVRIAIVGSPNVGKSSLLNAFLGRERAIVAEEAGTTRDTLEEQLDLGGLMALFIDTAGIRQGKMGPVERAGIERTRGVIATADLILLLLDGSRDSNGDDREILMEVKASLERDPRPCIVAVNKSDLKPVLRLETVLAPFVSETSTSEDSRLRAPAALQCGGTTPLEFPAVRISATLGWGLDALRAKVHESFGLSDLDGDLGEWAFATSARQAEILGGTLNALDEAGSLARTGSCWEITAVPLREAVEHLSRLVGGDTSADILGTIFSRFCVGK